MSRAKPAVVRFYLDADVLGLAHIVAALCNDATYPGDPGAIIKRRERPPCPVTDPATKDDVWIPEVASRGWLIITRDSRIQQHPAEIAAVKANSARMIALAGDEARGTWQQLEVLMRHWRSIEALATRPGPFVYTATRSTQARRPWLKARHLRDHRRAGVRVSAGPGGLPWRQVCYRRTPGGELRGATPQPMHVAA